MRALLLLILTLSLSMAPLRVLALQMPIYEGDVALDTGEDQNSEGALRRALVQVLVRVSGDRSVSADATLESIVADARRIALTINTRTANDGSPRLVANFDPGPVHDLLAALGRPVWHSDRPVVLIWLAIDDGTQKQIANNNQVAALGAITGTAQLRGIPTMLPRMDGVDQNRINPVTLWGAPPQTVIAAGQRYGVNTMLVIRLTRGTPWRARFSLIDGRSVEEWELSAPESNTLLAAAIDGASDRLARRYAAEPEGTAIGAVEWWVDDLRTAADYAAVLGYLGGLEFVRDVQPLRAEAHRLLLRLDLAVSERRLRQLLAIDRRIEFADVADAAESGTATAPYLHLVR